MRALALVPRRDGAQPAGDRRLRQSAGRSPDITGWFALTASDSDDYYDVNPAPDWARR